MELLQSGGTGREAGGGSDEEREPMARFPLGQSIPLNTPDLDSRLRGSDVWVTMPA